MSKLPVFRQYDVRGVYGTELDADLLERIAYTIALELYPPKAKILLSRDVRLHSPQLSEAVTRGLRRAGCIVLDLGVASTPMNYWANVTHSCDGSLQVTASHNPARYNGLKVSVAGARPIDYDGGLKLVEEKLVAASDLPPEGGERLQLDCSKEQQKYLEFVLDLVGLPEGDLPLVAIDASNGVMGPELENLCAQLPALKAQRLYWETDGSFPNHDPDPMKSANLLALGELVRAKNCAFGVAFDGDGDRCVFLDERGQYISCDLITALLAATFLKQEPGAGIIYDNRSSSIVPESILAAGGKPLKGKVGHSHMKKLLKESGAVFGGELSGHFYFRATFCADSALLASLLVLKLLAQSKQPLSELIAPYCKYFASGEISFPLTGEPVRILREIEAKLAGLKVCHLDGLSMSGENWRFNLRPGGTEPYLRLNVEAADPDSLSSHTKTLSALIEGHL